MPSVMGLKGLLLSFCFCCSLLLLLAAGVVVSAFHELFFGVDGNGADTHT